MIKKIVLFIAWILVIKGSIAQTVFDWANTTDGNFSGGTVNRWYDNFLATYLQNEPAGAGIILRFNNNNQLSTNNNVTGTYSVFQLIYGAGNSSARTLNGNPIRFTNYLGTNPKIENQSGGVHVLNFPIEGDGGTSYPLEINPLSQSLIFNSTINNQGSPVHILGGTGFTVSFNGVISGSGGFELRQNTTVVMNGVHSYTGTTTLSAGFVRVNNDVIPSSNGAFGNHSGGLFLSGGDIQINTTNFSRPVIVTGNNSFLDAYGGSRTVSAPVSASGGNWNLAVGANFVNFTTGQQLTLNGNIIDGSGILSLTKTGSSTCILNGTNNFSGGITISGGTLIINSQASLPSSTNLTLSGGTFLVGSVAASSVLSAGLLQMTSSSTLDLGTATNPFDLIFSGSGPLFTGTLTINNWSAVGGKRIRVTNFAHLSSVLSQIQFSGYAPGAQIRNGDELWPAGVYFTDPSGSGNYYDPLIWVGDAVPPPNSSIIIQTNFSLTIPSSVSLQSIDNAGLLTCSGSPTIQMGTVRNSKISNNGTIQFTNATVDIGGFGIYIDGNNSIILNNLIASGPIQLIRSPTINGNFELAAGSSVSGLSPLYGSSSTLIYKSGGAFVRNAEWTSYSGAGQPNNILFTNSTTVTGGNFTNTFLGCKGNLTINAGSHMDFQGIYFRLHVLGDIFIYGGLTLSKAPSNGADVFLYGNWTRSATGYVDFNYGVRTRRVSFYQGDGSNKYITGPPGQTESIPWINIQKLWWQTSIILNSPLRVYGILELNWGHITSSAENPLIIDDLCACGTGFHGSFVNGPVIKRGRNNPAGSNFTFPVGKYVGGELHYRPLTISPPANTTQEYRAEFMRANPYNEGGISAGASVEGLSTISRCEFWTLTKSSGAANVDVTLSWTNNIYGPSKCNASPYVRDPNYLYVVPYYNGQWGDQGSFYFGRTGVPAGNASNGTITWSGTQIKNYEKFVLGTTDWRMNPLPVQLITIKAYSEQGKVILNWKVTGNQLYKKYILEYSSDGKNFNAIHTINVTSDQVEQEYSFVHDHPAWGANYYRVVAVEWNDAVSISSVVNIVFRYNALSMKPGIFPNPITNNEINLYPGSIIKGFYTVQVFDYSGTQKLKQTFLYEGNALPIKIALPKEFSSGIYLLILRNNDGEAHSFRFMR